MDKNVKRGLVLSGGGAYGAFFLGVLKALSENKQLQYDVITGVSVGAIGAAYIGMFPKEQHNFAAKEYEKVWMENIKSSSDVYKPWYFKGLNYIASLWKGSVYSTKPLEQLLTKLYDADKLAHSGVDVSVGAVSLESQTYKLHSLNEGNAVAKILASASMVGLFPAVYIEGENWLDGGLRNMIPVMDAIQKGCTEIDVITCNPLSDPLFKPINPKRITQVGLRALTTVVTEVHKNDIEVAKLTAQLNNITLNIYSPSEHFETDSFDFDVKNNQMLAYIGYEETIAKFKP